MVITSTAIGGGGGGCHVEGVDEVSGRKWSAIYREAGVQAKCMTWLFTYFDVSWVVHGGARSPVPCLGRDAMEVRRGQGHMQASLEQTLQHQQHVRRAGFDRADLGTGILSCVLAMN